METPTKRSTVWPSRFWRVTPRRLRRPASAPSKSEKRKRSTQGEKGESKRNRNGLYDSGEWLESSRRAGRVRAGGHRRRELQNWFSPRTARPQRLRAFVRAHDVPRFRERSQDAAHQVDQFQRWPAERLDPLRRHQLLRGHTFQRAGARVVAPKRTPGRPPRRRLKTSKTARSR